MGGILANRRLSITIIMALFIAGCAGATNAPARPAPTPSQTLTPTPEATGSPLVGCLGPSPSLSATLAFNPSQRPACFDRTDVTFLAVGVATAVDCVPAKVEPAWLWCPPATFLAPPGAAQWRPDQSPSPG